MDWVYILINNRKEEASMIFGQYEHIIIDINRLVVLPQVRKIKNSKLDELADSISDRGLINPLDVARLNYSELTKHINFLNQLWKKNINIDLFSPVDGFYYVVIAGHSRLEALKKNAKSNKREDEVVVKIHKAKTSEEILAVQLDENIYVEPRVEERAVAIIETYRLGIMNGKWKDKNDFIKQNHDKFSKRVLNDALFFAELPLEIQEYVFSNNIFFTIGVELGKLYPLVEKYEADFDEEKGALEGNIKIHYATLLMKLQKAKSVKSSLQMISSHRKTLNDHFRPKDDVQLELLNWWADGPNRQADAHLQSLLNEYNKVSGALNSMPFEYFIQLFTLDQGLTGVDHSEDMKYIKTLFGQYLQTRLLKHSKVYRSRSTD